MRGENIKVYNAVSLCQASKGAAVGRCIEVHWQASIPDSDINPVCLGLANVSCKLLAKDNN